MCVWCERYYLYLYIIYLVSYLFLLPSGHILGWWIRFVATWGRRTLFVFVSLDLSSQPPQFAGLHRQPQLGLLQLLLQLLHLRLECLDLLFLCHLRCCACCGCSCSGAANRFLWSRRQAQLSGCRESALASAILRGCCGDDGGGGVVPADCLDIRIGDSMGNLLLPSTLGRWRRGQRTGPMNRWDVPFTRSPLLGFAHPRGEPMHHRRSRG